MPSDVTVEQLRAYRILASGLHRQTRDPKDLSIWDWGVQDSGTGSARLALANRLADPSTVPEVGEPASKSTFAMGWTWRGSPHVHRRTDFARLAAALWPADAADATARLAGSGKGLVEVGADPVHAYEVVAAAFRGVLTSPMTKGVASTAVTAAVPAEYSSFCGPCGVTHVREMLFRAAALPAAIGIVADTKPVVLAPLSSPFAVPEAQVGLAEYAAAFMRFYGVGTAAEIGAVLGTSGSAAKAALGETRTVTVDGRRVLAGPRSPEWIADADLATARSVTALLGPSDPLLQGRDRATLVAERERQRLLWPALGPPGALLAGGDIAGIWRARLSGRKLTITLTRWRRLSAAERTSTEAAADVVRAARGAAHVELVVGD